MERKSRWASNMGLWIAALVLAPACEKIIDIDIPDSERKIVVNGILSPHAGVTVNLSKSLTVLEEDRLDLLPGATVKIFEEEQLIGQLTGVIGGDYALPGFSPQPGKSYRLTADYPGLASVEAHTTVPAVVEMKSCDTLVVTSEWGYRDYRLKVSLEDPKGIQNYYGLSVFITYEEMDYANKDSTTRVVTRLIYIYSDSDMFLQDESHDFGGKVFFTDELFDGQAKSVEVSLYDYVFSQADSVQIDVHLEQLDPALYKYALSNEAYQEAHYNPFAEPVQVYNNITGGFGIFSSYSFSSHSFILPGNGIGK